MWLACLANGSNGSIYGKQNTILSLPTITTHFHFFPHMPLYRLVYPSKETK